MRLCSIASSSSGNCIYVGSDDTHILVDAGISGKRIELGLNALELSLPDISGILITHEHADHIASLGVLARRFGIPMYATQGTINGICKSSTLGSVDMSLFHPITADSTISLGDLTIVSQSIPHDANDPVAYKISCADTAVGVLTDLGTYNDQIVETFQGLNALLLEANHDVNMLQVGKYPYSLKQRILSDRGHLCNEKSGQLLCRLLNDRMKAVYLGHLSAENNLAQLAYEAVRLEIMMDDCKYQPQDINIKVADRSEISVPIAV